MKDLDARSLEIYNPKLNPLQKELVRELIRLSIKSLIDTSVIDEAKKIQQQLGLEERQ